MDGVGSTFVVHSMARNRGVPAPSSTRSISRNAGSISSVVDGAEDGWRLGANVAASDGFELGAFDVGDTVGDIVGSFDGLLDAFKEGALDVRIVGRTEGVREGIEVGRTVGASEGLPDGSEEADMVGI